jgi:hypothetical protein
LTPVKYPATLFVGENVISRDQWIWSKQALGFEHVALAIHANFCETTTVGKYCINTIGNILSSLDYRPTAVFGPDLYFQTVVFHMKEKAAGPWDVDYNKGPIKTVKHLTKENAVEEHLKLCEVYSNRSYIRSIK